MLPVRTNVNTSLARRQALKQQTRSPRIALKIYSREPVQKKEVRRALFSALESSSPSGSLLSHLNQILAVIFKVWSTSRNIQDVFLQIFGRYTYRKDSKTPLLHSTGAWNMGLQLYRQHGLGALPSKPWVELYIPEIFVDRLCKFQDKNFRVQRLEVRVGFHLQPQILEADFHEADQTAAVAPGTHGHPIHAIVDGALEAELRTIAGQVFADAGEMVSTVKDAVSEYLRSSPLARLVDFHYLEVAAISPKFERFVANTLLNADGSAKEVPTTPEHSSRGYTPPTSFDQQLQLTSKAAVPNTHGSHDKCDEKEDGRVVRITTDGYHSL